MTSNTLKRNTSTIGLSVASVLSMLNRSLTRPSSEGVSNHRHQPRSCRMIHWALPEGGSKSQLQGIATDHLHIGGGHSKTNRPQCFVRSWPRRSPNSSFCHSEIGFLAYARPWGNCILALRRLEGVRENRRDPRPLRLLPMSYSSTSIAASALQLPIHHVPSVVGLS